MSKRFGLGAQRSGGASLDEVGSSEDGGAPSHETPFDSFEHVAVRLQRVHQQIAWRERRLCNHQNRGLNLGDSDGTLGRTPSNQDARGTKANAARMLGDKKKLCPRE